MTGEEEEYTIHQVRGKLFSLQGNSWKERGTGVLKLNVKQEDGTGARLGIYLFFRSLCAFAFSLNFCLLQLCEKMRFIPCCWTSHCSLECVVLWLRILDIWGSLRLKTVSWRRIIWRLVFRLVLLWWFKYCFSRWLTRKSPKICWKKSMPTSPPHNNEMTIFAFFFFPLFYANLQLVVQSNLSPARSLAVA